MSQIDEILEVIAELDDLPAEYEPTQEELWDALRRIQRICEG